MYKSIFSLLLLIVIHQASGQDNNYWMQMPGSKSAIMGGMVVAGVRDNSAVFYNPGAMGFLDTSTVSLSASTYQYESSSIQNAGGLGVNMTSSKFQAFPLVSISGIIAPKKGSKHSFGFMLFTKNQTASNYSYRFDGIKSDTIFAGDGYQPNSPNHGVEYIGDYNLQTQLNELWLGFTYAYEINQHISIGLSPFIAYRTETLNESFVARAFAGDSSNFLNAPTTQTSTAQLSSINYSDIQSITFNNFRALGKLGIAFDYGKLKLGATYTSRSINLGGSAMIARDITYNGGSVYAQPSGTPAVYTDDFVLNDRQQNLKSTYISPYSMSAGVDYQIQRTTIAINAEYFGAVAPYNLATPQATSFFRPVWANHGNNLGSQINSDEYLRITQAAKSVTNFGIAVEQQIKRNLSIVASFRTDYTSYTKATNDIMERLFVGDTSHPAGQKLDLSNINLYHLSLGAILKNKRSDIHIGLAYCFGKNTFFQPFCNIANPQDINATGENLLGALPNYTATPQGSGTYVQNALYKYQNFSLLLGYTYHLGANK